MSNDDSGNERDDENGREGSIPLSNVFETLSHLLDQLEDIDLDEGERRSGSVSRGDATFDYNVNIGSINPAGESRRNRRRPRRDWDIEGKSDDREYHVQINERDGELVVIADLPAVSADDVDVEMNDEAGALEIRVDGELVQSVPLDWDGAMVTDVTFTNQILEVRVSPSGDSEDSDDSDPDGGAPA